MIPPGELHSVMAGGAGPWSVRNFFPDARSVRAAAASVAGQSVPEPRFRTPVIYDPHLANLLRRLHDLLETGDCLLEMETVSSRTGAELVARHSTVRSEAPRTLAAPKEAALARDYLEAHFDKNISLAELSAVAGLDRFPLVRASKHDDFPPRILEPTTAVARQDDAGGGHLPISNRIARGLLRSKPPDPGSSSLDGCNTRAIRKSRGPGLHNRSPPDGAFHRSSSKADQRGAA